MHFSRYYVVAATAMILVVVSAMSALAGEPVPDSPSAQLLWDACTENGSVTDRKDFSGPGPYHLVLSAKGLQQTITAIQFEFYVETMYTSCYTKPSYPDAWRFDANGCQKGQVAVSTAAAGPLCQGLGAANRTDQLDVQYDGFGLDRSTFRLTSTFDPVQPNPVNSYALAQFLFDHSRSVVGSGSAGSCGGAEVGMCFTTMGPTLTGPGGNVPLYISQFSSISWQIDPIPWCGYCDPAQITTWGRVKSLYR
jgi:hypothetical protein